MENDRLTLIGEKRLRQLLEVEKENEKLRKVCEAAIEVVRRYSMLPDNAPSLGIMDLEKQLKEWKGE